MVTKRAAVIAVAAAASVGGWWLGDQHRAASPRVRVIEVIDGDTIIVELPTGGTDTVRILGVDTSKIAQHPPRSRANHGSSWTARRWRASLGRGQIDAWLLVNGWERAMGIFKKLAGTIGHVSKDLMENGLLGRGQITDVKQTGMTMGGGEDSAPDAVVCKFTVQVVLDNVAPYEATCKQRVSPWGIPPPGMVVAVRVNPDDHSEIAIDWENAPPTVAMAAQPGQETAADILAKGSPARAVIVQSQPLGMKSPSGLDLYGFQLTIMIEGTAPYQIEVGNPVTPGGVPLIFPGSNVPAKYMPKGGPESVAIDWDAAVAEATKK